MIMKAEMRC